jgi:nifR3 family TIM-barrel protein
MDKCTLSFENNPFSTPLDIGGLRLRNRVFMAPMSGVTDKAFRKLAWRFGAGLAFSEMIASEALVEGEVEMALKALPASGPVHAIQLAGREPKWMMLAAKMAEANGADLIDINMGCPAKRVTTGLSGSALMREPDLALRLIEAVVKSVSVPVSVKMRLGWDDQTKNAADIARSAESAGVAMITVHGRTRCQFYKGSADWHAVSAARQAISIPLAVNGDIVDRASADKAADASGADAVMIGRGAYGAPWLPGEIAGMAGAPCGTAGVIKIALEHYDDLITLYGREAGLRQARKHLGWYLDKAGLAAKGELRLAIQTSMEPQTVKTLLASLAGLRQAGEAA